MAIGRVEYYRIKPIAQSRRLGRIKKKMERDRDRT